jgi:hypothetical protein
MPDTVIMMSNTQELANPVGQPCKADGWYGHTDGLHTVVVQVVNFTGRVHIEASLMLEPGDDDWFPIQLKADESYLQFPLNPMGPTGTDDNGDTATVGVSFKVNAIWLRARVDRTYISSILFDENPASLAAMGNVKKITLAR